MTRTDTSEKKLESIIVRYVQGDPRLFSIQFSLNYGLVVLG